MPANDHDGLPSTAAIAGHPIHPMLVPFPIAFLVGAFVTDLVFWGSGNDFWARGSFWLITAGLVMGAVAAVFGLIDFLTIPRAREHVQGWIHFLGNAIVLLIAIFNLLLRLGDPVTAILPWGMLLSLLSTAMLGVTGWMGGELAYRYMIGVAGPSRGRIRLPP